MYNLVVSNDKCWIELEILLKFGLIINNLTPGKKEYFENNKVIIVYYNCETKFLENEIKNFLKVFRSQTLIYCDDYFRSKFYEWISSLKTKDESTQT